MCRQQDCNGILILLEYITHWQAALYGLWASCEADMWLAWWPNRHTAPLSCWCCHWHLQLTAHCTCGNTEPIPTPSAITMLYKNQRITHHSQPQVDIVGSSHDSQTLMTMPSLIMANRLCDIIIVFLYIVLIIHKLDISWICNIGVDNKQVALIVSHYLVMHVLLTM